MSRRIGGGSNGGQHLGVTLGLRWQSMHDCLEQTSIHLDQMHDSLLWIEEILDTCSNSVLRQNLKLDSLTSRFSTPAEVRAEVAAAQLSDQRFALRTLERENKNLKASKTELEAQLRFQEENLAHLKHAAARMEDDLRSKLRSKHVENERLLQILQDIEHDSIHSDLLSKENAKLKALLKLAVDKSTDLTTLSKQLSQPSQTKVPGEAAYAHGDHRTEIVTDDVRSSSFGTSPQGANFRAAEYTSNGVPFITPEVIHPQVCCPR